MSDADIKSHVDLWVYGYVAMFVSYDHPLKHCQFSLAKLPCILLGQSCQIVTFYFIFLNVVDL